MIINVIGTGSKNKGAELMLHAIAQQRASRLQGHGMTVPLLGPSFAARRELGLLTTVPSFVPGPFQRILRLAGTDRIGAVLDASGFRYGDQWGAARSDSRVREFESYRKRGVRIVLLPQALGPFRADERVRDAFRRILELADIVYARDSYSFEFVRELGGPSDKLRQSADITIPLGRSVGARDVSTRQVMVIPNMQMIRHHTSADGLRYVDFLAVAMTRVLELGMEPLFVIHQTVDDEPLVEEVCKRAGRRFPVIREESPLELKRILGGAAFLIGSRFHALTSGLSQGVPAIGTSWSHKYRGLFEDFGVADLLIEDVGHQNAAMEVVHRLVDERERMEIAARLKERGAVLSAQVNAMWGDVAALLGRA